MGCGVGAEWGGRWGIGAEWGGKVGAGQTQMVRQIGRGGGGSG